MKKTGEILKKAREEKGLSLHEIGLSLKINSKILKAIEEGDETHLPAKTFLRGFVLSYANFLHLDSDLVMQVFYEEFGSTKPKPYIRPTEDDKTASTEATPGSQIQDDKTSEATVTPIRQPPPKKTKSDGMQSLQENKSTKSIAILVFGIILVGLIIFTKKMIDKYSKEAEVPTSEVAQTIEGVTPLVTESTTENPSPLENLTSKPATVTPAPTPSPTPVPTPTPTPSPTPTPTPAPSPTPIATPTPSPTPKAETIGKPVELIVEALDTVEIEYSSPTGKPQKIRLSAEQVHTFKSKSGLKITFSNGGAVNLILNGKEIGIPGDLGKPIKLSY